MEWKDMEDRNNPTSHRPGPEGVANNNSAYAEAGSGDYSFKCGDIMHGCDWQTAGRDEEAIRRSIEEHGREHHGMKEIGEDTWNKVKSFIRRKAA
jgi:predicted small metal-binding protein